MADALSSPSWMERNHFLLRRLHSLSGIIPVGAFLINHLLTNSTTWLGREKFNEHVVWIHEIPYLLLVEIFFIFIPLAFHAGYGIFIAIQGRSNATQYPYMDNWRYSLQRLTAWLTLAFIVIHLAHYRFAHYFGGPEYKAANPEFFGITAAGFHDMWFPLWAWVAIYAIGLMAAVFHFCNGIVTFCITWGITVGDQARKRVGLAVAGLGLVLLTWGGLSIFALATSEPPAEDHDGAETQVVRNDYE